MKPTFGITTQHKSQFEIIDSGAPIIEIMEPWEDKPFVPGSLPLPVNFVERSRIRKAGDRLASDLLLPVRLLRDSLKGGPGEGRAVLAVNSYLPVA
jgi:hypothetical protein